MFRRSIASMLKGYVTYALPILPFVGVSLKTLILSYFALFLRFVETYYRPARLKSR